MTDDQLSWILFTIKTILENVCFRFIIHDFLEFWKHFDHNFYFNLFKQFNQLIN